MADSDHVTVKEVNEAVLKIVQEGNQDAITTRSVTEDIVKMYGDRLGPLREKIKGVVRTQLKVLVDSEIVTSKSTGSTSKESTVKKEDVPSVTVENAKASSKSSGDATNVDGTPSKKKKIKEDTEGSEEKDDKENALRKETRTEKSNEGDTDKKKKTELSAEDEDEESKEDANDTDFKVDEELEEKVVKPRRTRKRTPAKVEESAESATSSEEPVSKRRRRKSVPKMTPSEKRLKKYLSICRQIGCPFPPTKFRGLELKEKIETVVQYLLEKGIDVKESIPTERELRKLQSKFARQKELAMLDESNIIETEGRRPRRNAAKNVSYSDSYEKEKAVEGENAEEELPPSSPEQMSDSEGYVASVASSDDDE